MLKDILNNLEKSMISKLAIAIKHGPSDGTLREIIVDDYLTSILPNKYSINNGFIIDSDDNISNEVDLIVYDSSYVPHMFKETYCVVPIESVIATIEVKSKLTTGKYADAKKNRESILQLTPRVGGSIVSSTGKPITESRITVPLNILIANNTDMSLETLVRESDFDVVYVFGENLIINNRSRDKYVDIVNVDVDGIPDKDEIVKKKEMLESLFSSKKIVEEDRLFQFSLRLLEKLQMINNTMIINYKKYYEEE